MRPFGTMALLCACAFAVPMAGADTIGHVETFASGTLATLDQNPVVTAVLSQPGTVNGVTYTNWSFWLNDGTGSLAGFGHMPAGSAYTPTLGDAISVSGTYSPFHQIPELGTLTAIGLVSSGNSVPAPA